MSDPADRAIGRPLAFFALTAVAIAVSWWWLGRPMQLPPSPLAAGEKLYCVSYAPFRGRQDPFDQTTVVPPTQIDEDLALLSHYTNCVRTYSVANGLDKVPEIAQRYGLKVLQGMWIYTDPQKNHDQISTVVGLANRFPDVITAVIVGNEVLLRGEMSATALMGVIREVKSQITQPVTYADVWEYWIRYSDLQNAVDFVTVHILPYWEDFPIPAAQAGAHVESIYKRVAAAFPGKQVLIGELGWPAQGRMRDGARPSPSNQARVIQDALAFAKRNNLHVNVIEAFDQPWKRELEGSAGAYWGLFDRATKAPKFSFGGGVSDHPHWLAQALAGILLAAVAFAAAWAAGRGKLLRPPSWPPPSWPMIAALAFLPAVLFGWTIERIPIESYSVGGWLRSIALLIAAAAAPVACAAACAVGRALPSFAMLLGRRGSRIDGITMAVGGVFVLLVVLAVEEALGLVFDPRYRDIVFAPLTGTMLPFLVLSLRQPRKIGPRAVAETVAAALLAAAAVYIVINESFANWQAVWLGASLIGVAIILVRVRDVPGLE
jgi:glucan 1,3-beta-glucosidase